MRKLQRLSMAVALTLMLGTYALAGIIECPPAPEPPPASATGTIETPPSGAQPVTAPADPVVDIALNLLQGALSLF
jgi:hypothetical protein